MLLPLPSSSSTWLAEPQSKRCNNEVRPMNMISVPSSQALAQAQCVLMCPRLPRYPPRTATPVPRFKDEPAGEQDCEWCKRRPLDAIDECPNPIDRHRERSNWSACPRAAGPCRALKGHGGRQHHREIEERSNTQQDALGYWRGSNSWNRGTGSSLSRACEVQKGN